MELTDNQVRHQISEIISGKRLFHLKCRQLPSQILVFLMPSHQIKLNADIVYEATLLQATHEGIPTRDEMGVLSLQYGFFDPRENQRLDRYEGDIKTFKLLRSRTRSAAQVKQIEHKLRVLNNHISMIGERQDAYFFHTAEAKAEQAKTMFLISQCVQAMDGKPFWGSSSEFAQDPRDEVQAMVIKEYLKFAKGYSTATIRYIARHYEWRIYWKSCTKTGGELFHGPTTDWDINKLLLCYWSDFYDNIYNHPSSPPDDIINDDFRCDAWLDDQLRGVNSGGISQRKQGGYMTVSHQVNEPYRLVTAEQYAQEQAAEERLKQ
jgi:hypothetical protein